MEFKIHSDYNRDVRCSLVEASMSNFGWLVGFGFNGPLRQYFSLYRAVSQREGERGKKGRIDESKNVHTTPTRTYCKRSRPLPYLNPNCRTPRHWKFTQHHRTTRPPPSMSDIYSIFYVEFCSFLRTEVPRLGKFQVMRVCFLDMENEYSRLPLSRTPRDSLK